MIGVSDVLSLVLGMISGAIILNIINRILDKK